MLVDPSRRWGPRAICTSPEDQRLFFADGGTPANKPGPITAKRWARAKEICAICPVLAECRRDTLGEEYGVFGGLDQHERWLIRRKMVDRVTRWSEEERLAWGKHLKALRAAGMEWRTITIQTGLYQTPAGYLISFYEENAPKEEKPGTVIDVPLPGDSVPERAFPDKPGRRHAWVRHRGLFSDSWYRGETPDGKWVYITTEAGRGQVHKWVPIKDVKMYRPQAVIILNYQQRPDDDAHDPAA